MTLLCNKGGGAYLIIKASERLLTTEHDVHLGAEVAEDAREFQADVSTADDDQLLRDLYH